MVQGKRKQCGIIKVEYLPLAFMSIMIDCFVLAGLGTVDHLAVQLVAGNIAGNSVVV